MKLQKLWYLIAMCFVLCDNLLDSATAMQPLFSLNTLQNTSGFGRFISKIKYTSFINATKGITLRISCLNVVYSSSVVLKTICIYNLLHHNTGHPAYVITYPIFNMTFYALSESDWAHPPSKLASTSHLINSSLMGL